MSAQAKTKHDATVDDFLNFVNDLKCKSLSKKLSETSDSKIQELVSGLAHVTNILKAHLQKKSLFVEEPSLVNLNEDASRIHALFIQSADPIMTLAPPTWHFTGCNLAALKLFEVASEQDFKKLGPWDLSPIEQPDGILSSQKAGEMISTAMMNGSSYFEWNHKTISGKVIACTVLLSRIQSGTDHYIQATVRDISKEREVLESLKRKTEELNSFYSNSPFGILELDEDFRIKRCNPAYSAMLEYSHDELIGRSVHEITLHEDKDQVINQSDSINSKNDKFERFEERYISKSGKIVWVAVTSRAINHINGEVRFLAFIENITEMKARAVETATILETMADGLVIQDQNGTIESHNPAALKLLGLSADQLLGKTSLDPSWKAIFENGSEFPGEEHPAMRALQTGHSIMGVKMGLSLPDGRLNWIKINAVPFETASGRKVACTFSDVTELLNAQREIRFILDALRIGVWKYNPVTESLHWDQSMYDLFDLTTSEFTGHYQAWESTLTPESKKMAVEQLGKALKGEKNFDTVFEINTKSRGKRFISGLGVVTRNLDGSPRMMFGINADVTEQIQLRKELELEREKSVRNSKLALLGEMSAGIAHEINNPLAIISLTAETLSKFYDNPTKLASKIEMIKKSCHRISRIVQGLKKFSRSGDKSQLKNHELNALVREALILTNAKSNQSSTPVIFDSKTSAQVLADEVEIEQVIVNLINNAIDAVKDKAERWVNVSAIEKGESVILRVTDSGPGIPEHIQNSIFNPFFTTKIVGEGTGLGLSIAKGILDDHKATIAIITDSPNTCFEIRFPVAKEEKNAA